MEQTLFSTAVHIPQKRVPVLLGKGGSMKKRIEHTHHVKIRIFDDGEVHMQSEDNLNNYIASNIVKAIGRGFNPDIALTLERDDFLLEIISIKDFSKGSEKKMMRLRGRVIGSEGKAWKTIESLTNTHMSVYGKTVSIIGEVENVLIAKHAIEKLLRGAPHSNAYKYIESERAKQEKLVIHE